MTTEHEIRKFLDWLDTLNLDQLCDLASYCALLAMRKAEHDEEPTTFRG